MKGGWGLQSLLALATIVFTHPLVSQESGVVGYWKEPKGSVVRVETCGKEICATLVEISAAAEGRTDAKNPDTKLRWRSLCGLRIGNGFHLTSSAKAEDGVLYDPETGNTYHGLMTANGNQMDLRGYIGFSLFGRTQRWQRTSAVKACTD